LFGFDLTPTCLKLEPFSWYKKATWDWRFISQKPLQLPSTWSCMQNLTMSLTLIETCKSCLTIVLRWTP
jgi:hypothetical protein